MIETTFKSVYIFPFLTEKNYVKACVILIIELSWFSFRMKIKKRKKKEKKKKNNNSS